MRKKFRTPQEKKRLSLEKDRRNTYGQADKASRRLIPLQKKLANKAVRRRDKVNIQKDHEGATGELVAKHKTKWQKFPDGTLQESIKISEDLREVRIGRRASKRGKGSSTPVGNKEVKDVR